MIPDLVRPATVAAAVIIGVILLFARRMPKNLLAGLGGAIVLTGAVAVVLLEWQYQPSHVDLFEMNVPLDRAATVGTPEASAYFSGAYNLVLSFDRSVGLDEFGCLTAEQGFERFCLGRKPELDLSWTVFDSGVAASRGSTDLKGWAARQARLDPQAAAAALKAFRTYLARTENPSNGTPLFHQFGSFRADAGHVYRIELRTEAAAPTLARLHPRLLVGFGGTETAGLGLMVIAFFLLCAVGGGVMLLIALVPRRTAS